MFLRAFMSGLLVVVCSSAFATPTEDSAGKQIARMEVGTGALVTRGIIALPESPARRPALSLLVPVMDDLDRQLSFTDLTAEGGLFNMRWFHALGLSDQVRCESEWSEHAIPDATRNPPNFSRFGRFQDIR